MKIIVEEGAHEFIIENFRYKMGHMSMFEAKERLLQVISEEVDNEINRMLLGYKNINDIVKKGE